VVNKLITTCLLFCITLSNSVLASDAKYLEVNEKAPFAGYLITPDRAKHFRDTELELNFLLKDTKVMEKQLANSEAYIDKLSKRLAEEKSDTFYGKVGFFILGSALTTAIVFGVNKASK
jgi:hypothetical protein